MRRQIIFCPAYYFLLQYFASRFADDMHDCFFLSVSSLWGHFFALTEYCLVLSSLGYRKPRPLWTNFAKNVVRCAKI